MKIHVPSMLAIGIDKHTQQTNTTNKHNKQTQQTNTTNKQAATMAYKIH